MLQKGKSRQENDDTFTTTEVFVGHIRTLDLFQSLRVWDFFSVAGNWALGSKESYFENSASQF